MFGEQSGKICGTKSQPSKNLYRFLIGGLSPQFNPPREESHLCYEGNE